MQGVILEADFDLIWTVYVYKVEYVADEEEDSVVEEIKEKAFEASFDLPDGYQVQLMVLRDYPGGRQKRGTKMNIFRSRVWIGHITETEPLTYRSQEHPDKQVAIDACYSTLLTASRSVIDSTEALSTIETHVHSYFAGATK